AAEVRALGIKRDPHAERFQRIIECDFILDLESRHGDVAFGLRKTVHPGFPVCRREARMKLREARAVRWKKDVHAHAAGAVGQTHRLKVFPLVVAVITRLMHHRMTLLLTSGGREWLFTRLRFFELSGPRALEINSVD